MNEFEKLKIEGGKNIAIKVPSHIYDKTKEFYRDILKLKVIKENLSEIQFKFGEMCLYIDEVEQLSQAEVWLEIQVNSVELASKYFDEKNITRCDKIEKLPGNFQGFWILNPANIVHLVSQNG
ncbi:MAG: hypothetical protein ACFFG0_23525 [Candidatus Thorarchaeota archaeon]